MINVTRSYADGRVDYSAKSTELKNLRSEGISQGSTCKMVDTDEIYRFYYDEDNIGHWNLYTKDIDEKNLNDNTKNSKDKEIAIQSLINKKYNYKGENKITLSKDWKFKLISSASVSSYKPSTELTFDYDDSTWDSVTVPHDWSIHQSFNENSLAGFDGGFLDGGDGLYRLKLTDISSEKGNRIHLYFDGSYMETTVYINGNDVFENKMGYNSFNFDISDELKYDGKDILVVMVKNPQPSSRWYSGSGLYRPVYIISKNPTEINIDSTTITCPNLKNEYGGIINTNINTVIRNNSLENPTIEIEFSIVDKNNKIIGYNKESKVLTTGDNYINDTVQVKNVDLWDVYNGNIYFIKIDVVKNNELLSSQSCRFGYRFIEFDKNGFYLNGKKVFLKGVCLHHDLGAIGTAVNKSAIKRQIKTMKDMGVNAIRTSHNPASKELVEICEDEGILIDYEFFDCWSVLKKTYDFARYFPLYKELVIKNTIMKNINSPSIIMWSIGNEIWDVRSETGAVSTCATLCDLVKKYDTTRPTTMGECMIRDDADGHKITSWSIACMGIVDVIGLNYARQQDIDRVRNLYPNKPIYSSECTSALSSRGYYKNVGLQYSSFDDKYVSWGDSASNILKLHENNDFMYGMFVWTGFDYIGEPTEFNKYPCKSSYFGIVDLAGIPKDIYYMYQSKWTNTPMVHIVADWTGTLGDQKNIWVYSNCYEVELFKGNVSLGRKNISEMTNNFAREYKTTYSSDNLTVKGYDKNGNIVGIGYKNTFSDASALKLKSDKTNIKYDSDDLVFITCDIVDSNSNVCYTATNEVTFTVTGGTIIGTDAGDASSVEKMDTNVKKTFSGKVVCIVKSDGTLGNIKITASSTGLTSNALIVSKTNNTQLTNKKDISSQYNNYEIYLDASNHGENKDVWKDLSGNNNHAYLYNFTHDGNTNGWADDGSLKFNGSNSYVRSNYNPFYYCFNDFEIEIEFKINATDRGGMYILGLMKEVQPWNGLQITSTSKLRINSLFKNSLKRDMSSYVTGNYCVVKVVAKNGQITYYLNGTNVGTEVYEPCKLNQELYLGANIIYGIVSKHSDCNIKRFSLKRV